MKVDELRHALKERGLDEHGLKHVLQKRLTEALQKEEDGPWAALRGSEGVCMRVCVCVCACV